jgi:hypothetical protein
MIRCREQVSWSDLVTTKVARLGTTKTRSYKGSKKENVLKCLVFLVSWCLVVIEVGYVSRYRISLILINTGHSHKCAEMKDGGWATGSRADECWEWS